MIINRYIIVPFVVRNCNMIKPHTRHECPEDSKDHSWNKDIIYLGGGWNLDNGDDGLIDIDYCPYCGAKLENE